MTSTFEALGLSPVLIKALRKKGFERPTPIQAEAIPLMLSGEKDIMGLAATGTGKTAAFGLPVIDRLERNPNHVQALIIAPTRELALQVSRELNELKGDKDLRIVPVYGGQSIMPQKKALKQGADIVVGTPGRLIDHMKSKTLKLSDIRYFVLDEADEMLTGGFIEEVEEIFEKVNPDCTTLLFSATMPKAVEKLSKKYMQDAVRISVKKEEEDHSKIEQSYIEVKASNKPSALCQTIDMNPGFYGFVFCRTKREVEELYQFMLKNGYAAEAMHGDLSQKQREIVLKKFREKTVHVLVVTDVASRGLDISDLTHVINYHIPQDPESYTHRVGRTGRAGQTGTAISFVTASESRKLKAIQRVVKTQIVKANLPSVEDIMEMKLQRLRSDIQVASEKRTSEKYLKFAAEILEDLDPELAVATLLKMNYFQVFSAEQYKKKKESTSYDKPRRSRRGFDEKDSDRGPGFKKRRAKPSYFSDKKDGPNWKKDKKRKKKKDA